MAYTKVGWTRGELVASSKLNAMDDGIYNNSVDLGIETDARIASDNQKVNKSGDTITGDLTMQGADLIISNGKAQITSNPNNYENGDFSMEVATGTPGTRGNSLLLKGYTPNSQANYPVITVEKNASNSSISKFTIGGAQNAQVGEFVIYTNTTPTFVKYNASTATQTVYTIASVSDIPSVLPNPSSLKFAGDATKSYDGSTELTVNGEMVGPSPAILLTTAPTAANTNGVKFVELSSEPAAKYSGYIYLIKKS